ncbi:LuxR family transcriptional regulator [Streptomyces mobaraensis]|uniref:helix-turn-helix transcriptional regulator n=1 Tax=Streptomyces mobaraensis TaxID=35621 RepID=UPI00332E9D68
MAQVWSRAGGNMDVLRSPDYAERKTELAALGGLLTEAGAGRGSVALVSGPAGSGKTHLLQTFCKEAEKSGALLLTAVASRAESGLPLGVMDQLFRCETLPAELRRRATALLAGEPSGSRGPDAGPGTMNQPSVEVANGLRSILLELSDRGPVVVGIDDLQYADGPSLQMLLFLQRRMKTSRVLLLLAELSTVRSPHPVFHAELFRQPNCRKIRLDLLSRSGVHSLIEGRLGPAKARELTEAYHAASGGSPLFLTALLDDHEAAHRPGGEPAAAEPSTTPAPSEAAFRTALTDCLYLAEPSALAVARAVAALGTAGSPALIGHALGMNTSTVEHAIASLAATGLLGPEDFRHPAARTAVLAETPPDARHDLHLRVAAALHHAGAPPGPVAEQLRAAERAPEAWMINVLREAARGALAAGRRGTACAYLDLALKDCADRRQLAALTADRMRIEWQKSPLKAMRHVELLWEALRAGQLNGHDAGLLTRGLLWHGRYREAREALALWKAYGAAADPEESEELAALTTWMAYSHPSLVTSLGGTLATAPPTGPDAARPFGRHAISVLYRLLADGAGEAAAARAEAILHSVVLGGATLESLHAALLTLLCADHPDKAAAWSDELLKEAEQHEAPMWQVVFATMRADAAFRQGDMATAVRHGEAALTRIPASAWGVAIGSPLAVLILATTMMGRYDEAVRYIRQPVPDTMFEARYGLHYLNARGHFHLATGRPAAALTDFESCGRLTTAWRLDLPALIPWRAGAAEAALALGLKARARALVEEQLTRPGLEQPRTRGATLRLLAATGAPEDRPGLLRQAVDLLRPDTGRFELARALADLRDAHEARGAREEAAEAGRRAAEMMASCQVPAEWARPGGVVRPAPAAPAAGPAAVAPVAPSDAAPDTAGQPAGTPEERRPPAAEVLSDAERRVAELAAAGVTNRAIGRKLFITVSTVEQHLTRVYRKLDVSRRRDLAARLGLGAPDAESA